jgi:hypothetical protein
MHAEACTRLGQFVRDPNGIAGVIIYAALSLMTRASASTLRIVWFGIMPDGYSTVLATPARMVPTNSTIPPTDERSGPIGHHARKRLCRGAQHDDQPGVGQHHRTEHRDHPSGNAIDLLLDFGARQGDFAVHQIARVFGTRRSVPSGSWVAQRYS